MTGGRDNVPGADRASAARNEKSQEKSRLADLAVLLPSEPLGRETAKRIQLQFTAANDNHPRKSRGD
jgi:hypothetical protein